MKKLLASAAIALCLVTGSVHYAQAEEAKSYTKADIEEIIQSFLMENPAVVVDALNEFQRQEEMKMEEQASKALSENMDFLVSNPDSPFVGKEDAKNVIVEFFDYNCGYCKRALADVTKVLEENDDVKVIFKELPILSPDSEVAARYALAAHEQGKYFEFHKMLMEAKGRLNEERILDIAKGLSLDIDKLKVDKDSDKISELLQKTREKSQEIGIRGTPAFIINQELVRGAIGYDMMKQYLDKDK